MVPHAPLLPFTACARVCVAAVSIFSAASHAQNTPESVREKTDDAPFYSSDAIDFTGMSKYSRTTDEIYPVSRTALIAISSTWGKIRVNVWDNPVARVTATITVGSVNADLARQYAEEVGIAVENTGAGMEILTAYPDVDIVERIGMRVDYDLSIPRSAELAIDNKWGDTIVTGLDGDLTLDTAFGVVELRDIGGYVRAQASQFPFIAQGLRGGGAINLRLGSSVFMDIEGSLSVLNQWGSVELRDIRDFADIYVQSDDGPVHFYVEPGAYPHIEAQAVAGTIESDILLDRRVVGQATLASSINVDATQRIVLSAAFDSIYIHKETPEDAIEPLFISRTSPIEEALTQTFSVPDGTPIVLDAIAGDIRVEGIDDAQITVTAKKRANVARDSAAQALDAMTVAAEQRGETFHIITRANANMEALGCTSYGIDVVVLVPRTSSVHIKAASGQTRVLDLGGTVTIEQGAGAVFAEHAKGHLDIVNRGGNVTVADCAGPATIDGAGGNATIRTVYGDLDVTYHGGNTLIESPYGGARVRQTGGDVRILAPEGLFGEFDIDVHDGNISMAVPETTDASFWMTAHEGAIHPDFPVSGTKDRGQESFQGQLNNGTYRVMLKTRRGNIVLD